MKRLLAVFLILALMLGCFAGCAKKDPESSPVQPTETETVPVTAPASPPAETAASRSKVVEVHNVDEFLAAIGPDTEIRLGSGTYLLTDAKDYGIGGTAYYRWENCYDGFELQLTEVRGLTICGASPEETSIQALSRYANVLTLSGCFDVILQNFTAGHIKGVPGECSGGVLKLDGCDSILVDHCGLYGCGIIGVNAVYSDFVTLNGCDIYECSSTGINLENCRDTVVENTTIRNLGDTYGYGAYAAISTYNCKRLNVTDCKISSNNLSSLFTANNCRSISLLNNRISENSIKDSVLGIFDSDVVFDGNQISGTVRSWYAYSYDAIAKFVVDASGKELDEDALTALYPDTAFASAPTSTDQMKEIHVSTADEFLAAINSDTIIILDSELIDLSTATGYGTQTGKNYFWTDNFDGPALIIHDVHNLTIRSSDGNTKGHTIAAVPRYADVLFFQMCSYITLSGFTAGHTQKPGYCMGGVFHFEQCDNVTVDHCGMYGCGILGIQASFSSGFTIEDCDIYECSQGGINMWNVQGITINRCTFRDLGGDALYFYECSDITKDDVALPYGDYNFT